MRDYQNKSMDKMGSISKDDKAFVNKKYDQDTLKRRKGVALAKSKLGEGKKGLWANIHAKRKRGEKPAKPGDEDYPDKKNWDDNTDEQIKEVEAKPDLAGMMKMAAKIDNRFSSGSQKFL